MKALSEYSQDPEFEKQRAALLGEVFTWLLERRRHRLEQEQKSTNEQGMETINDS